MVKPPTKEEVTIEEFLNSIVKKAAEERASDIHIEPMDGSSSIRFRIDGILQEKWSMPQENHEYLLNRLKVLANLDVLSTPVPQEGHMEIGVSMRLSIFPTINGEAAVLRLMSPTQSPSSLTELGMDEEELNTLKKLLTKSFGMVLITGPSGSGKTTTLYAILRHIQSKEKNIVTLEDPIEARIKNIRQSQIVPDRGFTFAVGMRSILRQDPDAIMIGEIRDPDTAEQAVRASLVGKAVFSTVHASTTVGTIARLADMGIERSLIAFALNGVIAERLTRKVCQKCRISYNPPAEYLKYLGLEERGEFFKGKGCEKCGGTGYFGRTGIFEILGLDDNLRSLIVEKAPMSTLQDYVEKSGVKTLKQSATEKILSGVTTIEEVIKVV